MVAKGNLSGSSARISKKPSSQAKATRKASIKATVKATAKAKSTAKPAASATKATHLKGQSPQKRPAIEAAHCPARQCQMLPAANAFGPGTELKLTVVAALSGRCLAKLNAASDWKVGDMKATVERSLAPGKFVGNVLLGEQILPKAQTLANCGVTSGSTLQVALTSTPVLLLASPCSASELCRRRGRWRWAFEKNGHDIGHIRLVKSMVDHHSWEKALVEAREIADALQKAAPGLESRRVCLTDHGLVGGEVIIIANATNDPRLSCLQALQIRKDKCWDPEFGRPFGFGHPYEFSKVEKDDKCWRSMQVCQEAEANSKAYFTWLKHKDDAVYHGNFWGLSTLRDVDLNHYVSQGFNEAFDEAKRDAVKGYRDKKGINPFTRQPCVFKGKPGRAAVKVFTGSALELAVQNVAATRVMAERLERHFKFDFGCGCTVVDESELEPLVSVAPVVYGGYAPDGSIVGILTARAKVDGSEDEDESESGPEPDIEDQASDKSDDE